MLLTGGLGWQEFLELVVYLVIITIIFALQRNPRESLVDLTTEKHIGSALPALPNALF